VAPRHTLLQVWMKEMERVGLAQFAEVIDSESAVMNSRAPIFVYHFDFPKLQTDRGKRMNKQGGGQRLKAGGGTYFVGYPIAKVIAKHRPPSLMIVDEIHRIRPGTDRTRCLKIVRKKAKRVLGLTGTPMDGWVSQAAVILGFIYGENSRPYPFSDDEFSKRFTKTKATNIDIATGKETAEEKERPVPGVNHMQIPAFLRCTKPLMHRLNLGDSEVRANVVYPPVDSKRILVPMDFDQQLFYQAIHKSGMSSARQAFTGQYSRIKARNNMLSLMQGLRQASVAPWELGFKDTETALVRTVVDIVKAHKAEGRKGLIGTTFIEESRYIHEALKKAGLEGVRIYAQDPNAGKKILKQEDRELLIEKFMEDPDCVYLIANKELVAEGLNLAETASYTVSCSSGYRANVESQWLARVARPGQQWPVVDAYTLLNDGTIDIYIHQLLQAKISATSAMIDLDFTSDADVSPIDPIELAKLLAEADGDPLELSA
jgi:SNF2 family DNA or RNA helicase